MTLRMTRRHILNWLFVISWMMTNWIVYLKWGAYTTLSMDVIWMLILLCLIVVNVQQSCREWMDKDVMNNLGGLIETNQDAVANVFALGWLSTNLGFYWIYGVDALIVTNVVWIALGAFMVWMKRIPSFNKWLKEKVYVEKKQ